ncbi:hypothetical protein LZ31DRAFT_86012 [Colletotrichum somersetense]|nr:hypothetical protein LZ31DRAFT_86012 [Colletotrichum somersetense]
MYARRAYCVYSTQAGHGHAASGQELEITGPGQVSCCNRRERVGWDWAQGVRERTQEGADRTAVWASQHVDSSPREKRGGLERAMLGASWTSIEMRTAAVVGTDPGGRGRGSMQIGTHHWGGTWLWERRKQNRGAAERGAHGQDRKRERLEAAPQSMDGRSAICREWRVGGAELSRRLQWP